VRAKGAKLLPGRPALLVQADASRAAADRGVLTQQGLRDLKLCGNTLCSWTSRPNLEGSLP
jgi:hypothetical protein